MSDPISIPRQFSGSAQLAGMVLEGLPERAAPTRPLVLFPAEAGLPRLLAPRFAEATFLYDDYAPFREDRITAEAWQTETPPRLLFSDDPLADGELEPESHDLALVFLPKGRERIEHAFSLAGRLVEPGGRVLAVGPKKSGILSSRDLGERYLGDLQATKSARHSKLLTWRRGDAAPPAFDGERRYTTEAWGHGLEIVSLPGVFSHGRVDDGTRFLLDHLELPEWETALDFGCGAGVLTAALLRARPETRVDAVDSLAPALEATRRTLRANRLDGREPADGAGGARIFPSDVLSDVPGRYDLVLTNPPFHSGHQTDFTATNRLIAESGPHLTPGGALVLVTNTFIDYLTPLRDAFRDVKVLAETGRYRVTRARRPA